MCAVPFLTPDNHHVGVSLVQDSFRVPAFADPCQCLVRTVALVTFPEEVSVQEATQAMAHGPLTSSV